MAKINIMVNDKTSQHELLNPKTYSSRLGIFQCVREILQWSLPIDHPVFKFWIMNSELYTNFRKSKLKSTYLCHTRHSKNCEIFGQIFMCTGIWIPKNYLGCQKSEYWIPNTIQYWDNPITENEDDYLVKLFE